jgi:hypothetical protein
LFAALAPCVRAQITWSLQADWSNTNNPNGVWTLTNNGTPFASQYAWNETLPHPVNAWAAGPKASGAAANDATAQLPGWYQALDTGANGNDYAAGDIYVHAPYTAGGYTSAIWTSPISGSIAVSGSIWHLLNLGRTNDWGIYKNDGLSTNLIASGSVGDSGNSRASPFNFVTGSGGAALASILVNVGDKIEFRLSQTSGSPYPMADGVTFIVASAVPEPSTSAAVLGLAGVCAVAWIRRRAH